MKKVIYSLLVLTKKHKISLKFIRKENVISYPYDVINYSRMSFISMDLMSVFFHNMISSCTLNFARLCYFYRLYKNVDLSKICTRRLVILTKINNHPYEFYFFKMCSIVHEHIRHFNVIANNFKLLILSRKYVNYLVQTDSSYSIFIQIKTLTYNQYKCII